MSNKLKNLLAQAERATDEQLAAVYKKVKGSLLTGRTVEGLSSDDSLKFAGVLKQMMEQRSNGTTTKRDSLDELAKRLAKDVGMSVEQAKKWISEKGNPYSPQERKQMLEGSGEWNGQERRGVRQAGYTAEDLGESGETDETTTDFLGLSFKRSGR